MVWDVLVMAIAVFVVATESYRAGFTSGYAEARRIFRTKRDARGRFIR